MRISFLCLLLFFVSISTYSKTTPLIPRPNLNSYQFNITKSLVNYVYSAAKEFHKKGEKAFPEFKKRGGKWFDKDRYIFIYDLKGNCIFHAMDPRLVGKNLLDIKDINGKTPVKFMIDIVKKEPHAGWVHYMWASAKSIFPLWKTSYVMLVTDPSGKKYFIGSGIYNMPMEQQILADTVNSAAELVQNKGKAAFLILTRESSPYIYGNHSVFVMTMQGILLVDPSFPRGIKKPLYRQVIDFTDALGNKTVQKMLKTLKTKNSAWIVYMWPKSGEIKPSKKLIYVKKITVDNQQLLVGSGMFYVNPIWMR